MKKSNLTKIIAIVGLFIITMVISFYSIELFTQDNSFKIKNNKAFAHKIDYTCYDGDLGSGQYALALKECKPGCPTDFYINWDEAGNCTM